jgi:hypothetical protein
MKKVYVVATLQVEGIHCWKECPFESVKFLRDPHRHIFHIEVRKEVFHDDRDIEFIILKRKILYYLDSKYKKGDCLDFDTMSCEMIAREILDTFNLDTCKVMEDNENGAIVVKQN